MITVKRRPSKRRRINGDLAQLPELFHRMRGSVMDEQTQLGLRLMIRLCTRTAELCQALWSEVDLDRRLLTISEQRMKRAFGPYLVPLAPSSLALLESLRTLSGHSPHLFPGREGPHTTISDDTWPFALHRLGYPNTVSGFRSAFEKHFTSTDKQLQPIIEHQLDHARRNRIDTAYKGTQYLPERVNLMKLWALKIDAAERQAGYTDLPEPREAAQVNHSTA